MAVFTYTYNKKSIPNQLKQEAELALGFSVDGLDYNIGTYDIFFRFFNELTSTQIVILNQVVIDHLSVETNNEVYTNLTATTVSIINGLSISGGTISGGTYYGDGSNLTGIDNFYVTGGTLSNNILTLSRNDNTNINVGGFKSSLSGLTDVSITGTTINHNLLIWESSIGKWVPSSIDSLIENVVSSIGIYISNNTTTTVISTQNTPTQIQSNNYNLSFATNFTMVGGVVTYTGSSMVRLSLDATLYFTSSNNQDLNFYFGKSTGGAYQMLTNTKGPARTQGSNETTFANTKGLVEVNSGDKLAIFVENTTSSNNVLVEDMNWTINS